MSDNNDGLVIGTRYGFRGWYVQTSPFTGIKVYGMRGHRWAPGVQTATCDKRYENDVVDQSLGHFERTTSHDLASCTCGFYTTDIPSPPEPLNGHPLTVVGVMAGWDEVIEGDLGFRSRSAELVGLLRPWTQTRPSRSARLASIAALIGAIAALSWVHVTLLGVARDLLSAPLYLAVSVLSFGGVYYLANRGSRRFWAWWHRVGARSGWAPEDIARATFAFEAARLVFPDATVFDTPDDARAWIAERTAQPHI